MTFKVPDLADCDAGVEPVEYACLVRMAEFQERTAGGIILTDDTKDRGQWGSDHARLVAVSPLAFSYAQWPDGARLPQVGDVVFVGKYPGDTLIGRDGKEYRLVSDREIKAVIERASVSPSRGEIAERLTRPSVSSAMGKADPSVMAWNQGDPADAA